ncbi:MAG: hypothetical protein J7L94_15660 [Caldisericaceae bacterium]|nr:hypothetical protein [Caldisericaceae bacterium]
MKRFGLIIVFLSALTGIIPFAGKPVAGLAIQQCFAALTPTIRMIYQSGMSKPSSTVGADARGGIKKTAGCDIVSLALEHRKENGFDILELSGDEYELYAEKAGDPLLPAKIVYIWVPPGSKVEDVNVKILQKKTLKQPFEIFPKQPEFPASLDVKKSLLPLRPDLVGSDQPFPESPVQFIETATLRGHSMLVFRVLPLQYIPATGSVIVNERFEWQFDLTPGQLHTLKYKKQSPEFEKMLDRTVINYQDVEESSALTPQPGETFMGTDQASLDTDCDYLIM